MSRVKPSEEPAKTTVVAGSLGTTGPFGKSHEVYLQLVVRETNVYVFILAHISDGAKCHDSQS